MNPEYSWKRLGEEHLLICQHCFLILWLGSLKTKQQSFCPGHLGMWSMALNTAFLKKRQIEAQQPTCHHHSQIIQLLVQPAHFAPQEWWGNSLMHQLSYSGRLIPGKPGVWAVPLCLLYLLFNQNMSPYTVTFTSTTNQVVAQGWHTPTSQSQNIFCIPYIGLLDECAGRYSAE